MLHMEHNLTEFKNLDDLEFIFTQFHRSRFYPSLLILRCDSVQVLLIQGKDYL